jgi:hypothetical protein
MKQTSNRKKHLTIQKYYPLLILAVFGCTYLTFAHSSLKASAPGSSVELGESQARLKHVPPTSWTSDDVGAWWVHLV